MLSAPRGHRFTKDLWYNFGFFFLFLLQNVVLSENDRNQF